MIIAIDGPAGAGKSTISTRVAKELGFQLVDTGALYRTVALRALESDVDLEDGPGVAELTTHLTFSFEWKDGDNVLFCDGRRVGGEIRSPEVSRAASVVSAHAEVRAALLETQRRVGRTRDSVLEGRDIGTVVFPDADVKVFLTASPAERARRRVEQLEEAGKPADYDEVLAEIERRDERDTTRAHAPLVRADDAVEIDSTQHTIDEVVERILELVDGGG